MSLLAFCGTPDKDSRFPTLAKPLALESCLSTKDEFPQRGFVIVHDTLVRGRVDVSPWIVEVGTMVELATEEQLKSISPLPGFRPAVTLLILDRREETRMGARTGTSSA